MQKVRSLLFQGVQVDVGVEAVQEGYRVVIYARSSLGPRTYFSARVYPSYEEALRWAQAYATIIEMTKELPFKPNQA